MDEGGARRSGFKTFHERLERRAIELSFSSSRDTFRGSLHAGRKTRTGLDLLQLALTSPRFDATDIGVSATRCCQPAPQVDQPDVAGGPQIPRDRVRRPSLWPFLNGTLESVPTVNVADLRDYVAP
jgi:zinc protease